MVPRIHFADEDFDSQQVDVLLAKELNKLSFHHRERINEEIHGVCCLATEETPEIVEAALRRLSKAIDDIPCGDKQAYLQSQRLFPNNRYVNNRNFRLMFLRCELFHAEKAAKRLVGHLDFLLEIFNDNKDLLRRPIGLDDLSSRSMNLLRSGCLQLLPVRDSSGRRVFVVTTFKSEYEVVDRIQLYLYFQSVLSEDIDNQRKGIVSIAFPGENSAKIKKLPSRTDRFKLARFALSAPIRYCAIHCCYPDTPIFRFIKAAYSLGLHASESTRYRLRFHTGGDTETRYKLMSYGIPVDQIPITSSGKAKVATIRQWLNARSIIEKQCIESGAILMGDIGRTSTSNIVECPCLNDVAIRPGKSYLCHPGNVRFKELLDKYVDEHAAANRRGKDTISWTIIEEIERANGRFLEWDNKSGFWIENKDRNCIRTRMPIYFRDHKRNVRVKRQRQKSLKNAAIVPYSRPNDATLGGSMCALKSYDKRRRIMGNDSDECNFTCCLTTGIPNRD